MDFIIHSLANKNTSIWSGGTTTQLIILPAESSFVKRDFEFRMSTATIEVEESIFTALPMYNRLLAVLEGSIQLIHEGKSSIHLSPFESTEFHGSWKTSSIGKARDFNILFSDNYTLQFSILSAESLPKTTFTEGHFFLFCLSETGKIHNTIVKRYDLIEILHCKPYLLHGSFFWIQLYPKTTRF